jgi:hypothetical protein
MTASCPDEMMQVGHRSASQSHAPRGQWLSEVLRPLNLGSTTMSDQAFPRSRWEVRAVAAQESLAGHHEGRSLSW